MLNTCLMFEFLSSNIFKRNGSYVIMLGSFNDCKVRKHDDLCDVECVYHRVALESGT